MGIKIICENRQARFNYNISDKWEAGIMLTGSEVKSLRDGAVNLGDSYAMLKNGEVFLLQAHISPYKGASYNNHEPMRMRKLLLNKSEIKKMEGKTHEKGLTLVPLKMYFKEGRAKVELGLGQGKTKGDKRESIKKREVDRNLRRVMKR